MAENKLRILFVGNSYTYFNQMPETIFTEKAFEAGINVDVTSVTSGGYRMSEEIAVNNDGAYTSAWVGGPGVVHKVESVTFSDDTVEYVVQYYHDTMHLVRSHKIKITTEKTDDEVYEWKITGIERIEESSYEPYKYVI